MGLVLAVYGELVKVRKIIALSLVFFCSNAYCTYTQLNYFDIFKYHACEGHWINELFEIVGPKCSPNISINDVNINDDRVLNKYLSWQTNKEKVLIVTASDNVENVLEILQEAPLEYTIKTSNNQFSGVFYNTSSKVTGGDTFVKCDKVKNKCTITNNAVSYDVTNEGISLNFNMNFANTSDPIDVRYSAFEFAFWVLNVMETNRTNN